MIQGQPTEYGEFLTNQRQKDPVSRGKKKEETIKKERENQGGVAGTRPLHPYFCA